MRASELRIGNSVLSKGTNGNPDKWVKINVQPNHIETCKSNPRLFKGIKLTENKLLKLGAIKKDDGEFDLFGYNIFTKCDDPIYFGQQGCCMIDKIKSGIKYVHELQNLCFALTGKEL